MPTNVNMHCFPAGGPRRWSVHTVNWLAVYLPDNSRSSAPQTDRWTDRQTGRGFFFQRQISLCTIMPLHLRRAKAGHAAAGESETMGSDTEKERESERETLIQLDDR